MDSPKKCYILKSTVDNTILKVNKKVINSSILLKNICELANKYSSITIEVNCSGKYLKKFVEVIQFQEDEYENNEKTFKLKVIEIFEYFNDANLADFVKKVCILDSDILLDSIADIIIEKLKAMTRKE